MKQIPGKSQHVNKTKSLPHQEEGTIVRPQHSLADLRLLQEQDDDIRPVLQWMRDSNKPTKETLTKYSLTTKHYVGLWEQLSLNEGILYKKHIENQGPILQQMIVPVSLRKEILKACHNNILAGHLGIKKTKHKVSRQFYWYEMKEEIRIHILSCEECGKNKTQVPKPKGLLGHIRAGAPWEIIGVDLIGPLPITERGNRYIIVFIDYFTKWVEIVPIPDQSAQTTSRALLDENCISIWMSTNDSLRPRSKFRINHVWRTMPVTSYKEDENNSKKPKSQWPNREV